MTDADFVGLARAVARLTNAIAELEAINAKQAERIAELEAAAQERADPT
jgi:hypothetical protein